MTQHEIILNLLADNEWTCTNAMYASYIADPRTRLAELKKKGYILAWRWCQAHTHKKSKEWHLISSPQDRKISMQEVISPTETFYKNLKQEQLL